MRRINGGRAVFERSKPGWFARFLSAGWMRLHRSPTRLSASELCKLPSIVALK